jgi:hypothetical protein
MPAGLTDAELHVLSAGAQVDLLVVLERRRRRVEAAQLRLLAVMQARDDSKLKLVQEEVSLALQVPLRTAQLRLAQATTLVTELPRTLAAVAEGSISAGHANVLAEAVWRLPADRPELPAALEQRVLPSVLAAGTVTVRQLHGRVRRAVLALDPATAEQRHQRALAERRVEYRPEEDGMASLYALLPAPGGATHLHPADHRHQAASARGCSHAGSAAGRPVHRRTALRPAARGAAHRAGPPAGHPGHRRRRHPARPG